MFIKFFFFLLLFAPVLLWGQERFYFSRLDVKEGLSNSSITSIFQDNDGYLWFGTSNGLNKFDGYRFRIYQKDGAEGNNLSDNEINDIDQDSSGHLWILTPLGIDCIDHETDDIRHYRNGEEYFRHIICHRGNILAFTDTAVYGYDRLKDTFNRIEIPFSIRSSISAVTKDAGEKLYLGTSGDGVWICDASLRFFRHIPVGESAGNITRDVIRNLLTDADENLWITLDKTGIERYHLPTGTVARPVTTNYNAIGHHIRVAIDWDHRYLLLGTFNGLALLDKHTLAIVPVPSNLGKKGGLSHYSVYHLFKDKQQTLWVGTYSGGINYHNRYNNRFEWITAKQFSGVFRKGGEDRNGKLWFATEGGGLLYYDPQTGEQKNYLLKSGNSVYYNNLIKTLLISGDSIFCTTFGGRVYSFSPRTEKFRLLYDFKYNDIYSLYQDSKGRLWIPTNTKSGLVVADGNSVTERFKIGGQQRRFMSVSVVQELPGNRFLIGTWNNGFYLYSPGEEKAVHFANRELGVPLHEKIYVSAFYVDSGEDIWVSTNGHGLWRFDAGLNLKKHYTAEAGMTDRQVYYTTQDKQGYYWVMTCHELYHLDKEGEVIGRFNARNGIELQEFSIFSGLTTGDGKLYLSGMNGFQCIDPLELRHNTEKPPVLLTSLYINNREITPQTAHSPLTKKLQQTQKLVLNYNQTNISIGYTALNYIYPEQNQYAYKLEGADTEWNYVKNRREAFYSNLPPGSYRFKVVASNNDGVWNDKGTSLQIVVLPPYWLRWWAYLVYALIVGFILWKYTAWIHKKRELETRLRIRQMEQEKQEELNQERNRFFTHVTHELRTPLTLILNPAEELAEEQVMVPEVKKSVNLILQNARRLLSLVNNLMDIQKRRTGKKELQLSSFDFKEFLQEIYYNFQTTAQSRNFSFRLDFPYSSLLVTYDREELEKVFFNLLSNAFKFTPAGGEIVIGGKIVSPDDRPGLPERAVPDFSEAEQWLYVAVRDSGIGIREADREKLFEPFGHSSDDLYQKTTGSGIGLNLSRMIIEQHRGKIFARPLEPGTEIGVLLPLCYQPEIYPEMSTVIGKDGEEDTKEDEMSPDTTILLVEDNLEILDYVCRKLQATYRVITAVNGQEAFEAAEKYMPDMVISDVMMPVMSGVELCMKIKNTISLSHIPVILLTAKSLAMHVEEGFDAGADDYIVKPFSLSLLRVRIRNLLAGRQRMQAVYYKRFSLENIGIKVESIDDMFMNKYMEVVRKHIAEPDFGIDEICREIGLSRANFYRKVKAITNLTPVEMIRNIRLETAARLLKESGLSISEIAFKVGFNNHSYFTSCFKALYGISPTEYQERERGQV